MKLGIISSILYILDNDLNFAATYFTPEFTEFRGHDDENKIVEYVCTNIQEWPKFANIEYYLGIVIHKIIYMGFSSELMKIFVMNFAEYLPNEIFIKYDFFAADCKYMYILYLYGRRNSGRYVALKDKFDEKAYGFEKRADEFDKSIFVLNVARYKN